MIHIDRIDRNGYEQLATVQEGYIPDPDNSIVVLAKDKNEIVGRTMLIRPWHIEGTWLKEGKRRGVVGHLMLNKLEQEAKSAGISQLFSYAMQPEIEGYLERMGYKKQPVTVWTKDI